MAGDLRALALQAGEQHHEFVAAEAGHGVLQTHAGFQARSDQSQHGVADRMAERVVDVLEVVEVEEQQGAAQIMALEQGDLLGQAVHQQGAVGQVGQRIVVGQVLYLRLRLLQFADIARGEQQAGYAIEFDGLHGNVDQTHLAVTMPAMHFHVQHLALLGQVLDHAHALFGVGPDVQLEGRATDYFVRQIAGDAGEAFVDLDIAPAVTFGDGDGVRAGVEGLGELLFRGLQALLAQQPLADIDQRADHALRLAGIVELQFGGAFEKAQAAIFQLYTIGDLIVAAVFCDQTLVALAQTVSILHRYLTEEVEEGAFER